MFSNPSLPFCLQLGITANPSEIFSNSLLKTFFFPVSQIAGKHYLVAYLLLKINNLLGLFEFHYVTVSIPQQNGTLILFVCYDIN